MYFLIVLEVRSPKNWGIGKAFLLLLLEKSLVPCFFQRLEVFRGCLLGLWLSSLFRASNVIPMLPSVITWPCVPLFLSSQPSDSDSDTLASSWENSCDYIGHILTIQENLSQDLELNPIDKVFLANHSNIYLQVPGVTMWPHRGPLFSVPYRP